MMFSKMRTLKFFLLITFVKVVQLQKFEGDNCVLQNVTAKGKCTKLEECPSALKKLRNGNLPKVCGFIAKNPIVCCELEIKSKNEMMCEKYIEQLRKFEPPGSIVGGKGVSSTDFPHMTALGFGTKENIRWHCGGSLISERFVLTAAHCLRHPQLGAVKFVRMGDAILNSNLGKDQNFEIVRRIRHPEYKPPVVYNDIALLELNQTPVFDVNVKPACLNSKPLDLDAYLDLTATGWGLTTHAGVQAEILQKVSLDFYNSTQCINAYRSVSKRKLPESILVDRQVCAGSEEEKDTCQGDSGGPLQIYLRNDGLHSIVGITAFGKACGTPGVPSVYSRVSYYVPWIESVVWPN